MRARFPRSYVPSPSWETSPAPRWPRSTRSAEATSRMGSSRAHCDFSLVVVLLSRHNATQPSEPRAARSHRPNATRAGGPRTRSTPEQRAVEAVASGGVTERQAAGGTAAHLAGALSCLHHSSLFSNASVLFLLFFSYLNFPCAGHRRHKTITDRLPIVLPSPPEDKMGKIRKK